MRYISQNRVLLDFLLPAYKTINNAKLPKGNDFSIISIGKVANKKILKKNIKKKYAKDIDDLNVKVYLNTDESLWNI